MRLHKDILSGTYIKPRLFLCETNKEIICQLETTNTQGSFKFNSMSELSFETARVYNDPITGETKTNPYYNKIEALRLIYLEGFGYFELQGPELISDGIKESKSCTAYSLEYTLAQKYLENFYVNMGTVESLEVINASSEKNIVPITLYNPSNPKLSLLHLVLSEIYGWKIGHIDASLQTLSRQFEVDRESVYDFLMNEVCEKFNCYIVFDTIENTINIYAESLTAKFIGDGHANIFTITPPFSQISTVSVDGYKTTRWKYDTKTGALTLEDIPESGAHIEVVDGALTEWETDVFVSFENLAQEVNINYDADAIKTRLTVTYGDDYDIREVNLGLPYLTDISYYYTVDWMGQDLYDAYTKYLQKSNNSQTEYTKNSQEILKWNDYIAYEENRLSLEYSLVESVNSSTVGTYYTRQENLDGSYYYSEVSLPSEYVVDVDYYSNVTTNVNEEKVSNLYEVLQKYFYAYFNGQADGIAGALNELRELLGFEFMETYTLTYLHDSLKSATSLSDMDTAIYNFLNEIWAELGRNPLRELYLKPYRTTQETNIKAGWSNKTDSNYGNYYPVTLFITSIESAITQRDTTINGYKVQQKVYQDKNAAISDSLLMRNNFTEVQLIRLSAFLREDELHLDDIVETSLDDVSSSFKIKQDAMESGRIELQKLCQPQLQFSMTMANIYALPEFAPIIHQFQLGKVIKVCLRSDYIKQSRLLQVDINFDDFSDFSCEFGELTSLRTQSDIHADLLSKAISAGKSVATNSSYWTRGSDTATSVDLKIQQGLLDATTQIKAMDGSQGVIIDKWGIHLQNIDPLTGKIDPKQGWITNNKFLYTDDGFKSTKSVFGEYTYDGDTYYGILAEALVGNLLIGSQIKLENNDGSMTFDNNGLSVSNKINSFNVNPNSKNLFKISNKDNDILYVDTSGDLNVTGTITATRGNIGGCEIVDGVLKIKNANIGEKLTSEQIDANNIVANGVDVTGTITATAGNIGGCEIFNGQLQVPAAHITDKLTANQIDVADVITVGGIAKSSDIPTSEDITTITKDTVTTSYVNALNVIAGSVAAENISGTTITGKSIIGGDLLIGDKSADYAEITKDGVLNANGVNITGTVNSINGNIGGWNLDSDLIYKNSYDSENNITYSAAMRSNAKMAFAVYKKNGKQIDTPSIGDGWDYSFYVSYAGKLYSNNAEITGNITATSGAIGGWTLSPNLYGYQLTSGTPDTSGFIGLYTAYDTDEDYRLRIGKNFSVNKDGDVNISGGTIRIATESNGSHFSEISNRGLSGGASFGYGSPNGYLQSIQLHYYGLRYRRDYADNTFEQKNIIAIAAGKDTLSIPWKQGIEIGITDNTSITNFLLGKWNIQESSSATPITSDRNKKKEINDISDAYNNIFDLLIPVTYKYNDGTSDRLHTGFIAQDVENAVLQSGIDTKNFAAVCYENDENGNKINYKIRYDEFVALNTWQIQKLKKRVAELEAKLESL